ncbi:hypothetical protein [Butyrivibrio sp. FCS006]|uniref:hypothetical protein n=1 Tax=Butyrivibrio sp. FCS006 TaxID=1280684 RepID=UPI00041D8550|nr:hypothetical protein [Butyrivibrio sp. FCS006]
MNKQKVYDILLLTIAVLLILMNAIFFESKKEGFFLDEKATFHIANASYTSLGDFRTRLNNNNASIIKNFWEVYGDAPMVLGQRYSYAEVSDMFDAQKGEKFTFLETLILTIPDSHPPFYYLLFNVFDSLLVGVSLMHVGFIINIIALLLTCILLFRIIFYFTEDRFCSVLGVLFYGLSYDLINSAMYIRMYALLTFWFVLLQYLYLSMVKNNYRWDGKLLLKICIVEFFAMLTQFYAAIFIFLLFCITVIIFLVHKMTVKKYILSQIVTAVVYLIVWPVSVYQVLVNGRTEDIKNNAASFKLFSRLKEFSVLLRNSIFGGSKKILLLIFALIMLFGLLCLIKAARSDFSAFLASNRFALGVYLVIPASVFYVISAYISPWVVDRYVMPSIPIICAIIVIVFWKGSGMIVKSRYIRASIIALFVMMIYVLSLRLSPEYAFPVTADKIDFINEYQGYEALIVDPENDSEYLEVAAEVAHPYWMLVKDNQISSDQLVARFDKSTDTVVYINKFCDTDELLLIFENADIELTKCGYSTDFFDVYKYEAR